MKPEPSELALQKSGLGELEEPTASSDRRLLEAACQEAQGLLL